MNTLTDYLKSEFDKKLASIEGDKERYRFLLLQWNVWQQKYGRFIAAGCLPGDLPAEFSFGPYGTISAGDFLIVLGMIDAAKTKLERVPA
jgi:hypothetical protein